MSLAGEMGMGSLGPEMDQLHQIALRFIDRIGGPQGAEPLPVRQQQVVLRPHDRGAQVARSVEQVFPARRLADHAPQRFLGPGFGHREHPLDEAALALAAGPA